VRPDGYQPLTLGRGLATVARRFPDKTALICETRKVSYGELPRRMHRLANATAGRFALRSGDRVALIAPNCIEYLEIVVGLADLGVVVATLSPRMAVAELATIFADCTPRMVFVHPGASELGEAAQALRIPTILLGPEYEALLAAASDRPPGAMVEETDPFALAYTSGTTGAPKGVLLSHRSRSLTFMAMAAEYGCFGPDDHFLALAPMYHGAGFVFALAPLYAGGTATILPEFDEGAVVRRLSVGDIDGVFVVPTHLHRMLELPRSSLGTHRLRTIISNAAALPQPLKERTIDWFGHGLLHETYGSTEAGIVTNIRPADLLRKPNSVGVPFLNMAIELRDDQGQKVPDGTPGELFACSPYAFNGYHNRPGETAETLIDGWVTVGDMAIRDSEGFYTIVDRKKDMVVTGGINVYPREIENVIAGMAGVSEVAVVGLPDAEWGERLHAFVVNARSARVDADTIVTACRAALAGYKVPRGISFVDELPRNAGGKVIKRQLRAEGAASRENTP
jgi:long-chain acyl-CoA synthetase